MRRWRLLAITLAGSACLAPGAVGAGEIYGTVSCGERCADFVVYLEEVAGDYDGTDQVVELGQKHKTFIPHVLPLLKGSTLRVGNDDSFMHNVHARKDGETIFNFNVLFQYQTVDQVVADAGIYRLSCEPHPEMSGVLVALDNPFFTQPDAAGRYEIPDVPPGSYELIRLDAEKERRRSRRVAVAEGRVRADF